MKVTLELPHELGSAVVKHRRQMSDILQLGFKEWESRRMPSAKGLAEVLQRLSEAKSPQEALALRPGKTLARRIEHLLEKNRETGLTELEREEMAAVLRVEHLVRLAKAGAAGQLKKARAA
jgi:hypothetical protein